MALTIDIVSRGKKILHRYRADGDTISIGRSFENDVVLNDPYVCAEHLSLFLNSQGIWEAHDCQTINGSYSNGEEKFTNILVQSGDIIQIGKTRLRFMYPHHGVAPTVALGEEERLVNWLGSPMVLLLLLVTYFALLFGDYFVHSFAEIQVMQMLANTLLQFTMLLVIPIFFAILARFCKNDARILTQLAICLLFVCLTKMINFALEVLNFNLNQLWFSHLMDLLTEMILVCGFFWLSFYVALYQPPLRRGIFSVGATAAIFLLAMVYDMSKDRDFNPSPSYDATLLAPEFAFSRPVSVEAFIARGELVFEKSSQQATEE